MGMIRRRFTRQGHLDPELATGLGMSKTNFNEQWIVVYVHRKMQKNHSATHSQPKAEKYFNLKKIQQLGAYVLREGGRGLTASKPPSTWVPKPITTQDARANS